MIKMVLTDLDGTLLDSKGNVPEGFGEIVRELRSRGVILGAASGRPCYSLRDMFSPYGKDLLLIAENGGYAEREGEELFCTLLKDDSVREIVDTLKATDDTYTIVCGQKSAYIIAVDGGARAEKDALFMEELHKYFTSYEYVEDYEEVRDGYFKVALFDCIGGRWLFSREGFENLAEKYPITSGAHHWVDVMCVGVNKGVAVRAVMEKYGIRADECLAFGDYLNDLEMMRTVGHAYVMENGHEKLKELAEKIVPGNDKHGVITTLQEMIKEGRFDL